MAKNEDAYEGNGRLSGSVGKASLAGLASGAATAIAGATYLAATSTGNPEADLAKAMVVSTAIVAVGFIGSAIGAVQGWHKADAAMKQHDHLVQERDSLKTAITNAIHDGLVTPKLELQKV